MCSCIEDIRKKLEPDIIKRFSKPKNPVQCFNIKQTISGRAAIDISINLRNQIKTEHSFMVADYCPWCGQKYPE